MLPVFRRAGQGILSVLGEDSFLRSGEPCKVAVEHDVQLIGPDGLMTETRNVATISRDMSPKAGDALQHPDGAYVLDRLLDDNGVNPRFILRSV